MLATCDSDVWPGRKLRHGEVLRQLLLEKLLQRADVVGPLADKDLVLELKVEALALQGCLAAREGEGKDAAGRGSGDPVE